MNTNTMKLPKGKLKKLAHLMDDEDVDRDYLALKLERSISYINERMSGRRPWTIEEGVQICQLLNIPFADFLVYLHPGYAQYAKEHQPEPERRTAV